MARDIELKLSIPSLVLDIAMKAPKKEIGSRHARKATLAAAAPIVGERVSSRETRAEMLAPVRFFTGDTSEMIKGMRKGVPASLISNLAARFGISQDVLFEVLRLSRNTMKSRISKRALLFGAELDRMYRADRVWSRAVEVLEDDASARIWINRSNRSLGGEAPLSLLDTEVGYELVLDTLGRIEHGVAS